MNVFKYLFCFTLITSSTASAEWSLRDKKNNLLYFDWVTQGDLHEEEALFLRIFKEWYKDVPESYFGPQGLMAFLQKHFDEEKSELNNRYFVSSKKEGKVVGFASFKKTAQEHEVHLNLIAVDAAYRRCGIGEELILSILKKLPDTKRIVLDTRKKNNQGAIGFYEKLGFKECACIDKTLPQQWYTGFEGSVNELVANIKRLREPLR
jgi:ribosomal protein S18 acetylase RimI-like enzyme